MTSEASRLKSVGLIVFTRIEEGGDQSLVSMTHDPLTGCLNLGVLRRLLAAMQEDDVELVVVSASLKNTRAINADHSFEVGNAFMRRAAERLVAAINDLPVYRIGGDEFAVVHAAEPRTITNSRSLIASACSPDETLVVDGKHIQAVIGFRVEVTPAGDFARVMRWSD